MPDTRQPRVIRLKPKPPPPEPSADDIAAVPVWRDGDPCHALPWDAEMLGWDEARRGEWTVEVERLVGLGWGDEPAGYLAYTKVKGVKPR